MNLDDLLADDAFDLPVPPDALTSVRRRSARMRVRRNLLVLTPVVAMATAAGTWSAFSGGTQGAKVQYGVTPTASPTPPPLPYQDPKHSFRMACIEHDTKGVVDPGAGVLDALVVTGDPIADCAAIGRAAGFQVPLRAYYSGEIYLTVVPASWVLPASLPETYRPLPAGWKTDPKRYTLNLMLSDEIAAVTVGSNICRTHDETVALVRRMLAQVGLNYSIDDLADRTPADGKSTCGFAYLPVEQGSAIPVGSVQARDRTLARESPFGLFINDLRERFKDCLTLPEARSAVAQAGSAHGQTDGRDYEVMDTNLASDRCTRINFVNGGGPRGALVILRHGG